jgi:hypothetical protein
MPRQVASDEDRLVLVRSWQLHPRELVAPAREVEQAEPVPSGEADEPLGPQQVAREALEQALERVLVEGAR